jgi:ribosomal protein S18 acetylase RimI-like enzyme
MSEVSLIPMADDEYAAWRARIIPEYAAEHVATGAWTPEEAPMRAERQFNELLVDGPSTPGQYLWTIRDGEEADVGVLWVALIDNRPGHAFIYEIWVSPDRRGEGLGSAALSQLESWAPKNGVRSIGLHVFGHNGGARRLYHRLGFVETNVQMEKQL